MKVARTLLFWMLRLVVGGVIVLALVQIMLAMTNGVARLGIGPVNPYIQQIVILAGVNIILAVSLNLINGVTGQFSLGHAGFMAVGAYAAASFTFYAGPRLNLIDPLIFAIALIIAALAAGLAGLVVGLPSLRLRGDYLAIVTLGFGQIIISIIRNVKVLGEASGFNNLPLMTNFAWVYGLVILCLLSMRNLCCSELGRSMRAVREDEIAAEAVGINTTRVKVIAFVISSMWAGVAGALQVHYLQLAHPNDFTFMKSVESVVMVVLGGLGSITGSTIVAVLLKVIEEKLRDVIWAYYIGLTLVAAAALLSLPRHLPAIRRNALATVRWAMWPTGAAFAIWWVFHHQHKWLEENVSPLRYVIYALILIVLMLLRPQGLLGRAELSWPSRWRRGVVSTEAAPQTVN